MDLIRHQTCKGEKGLMNWKVVSGKKKSKMKNKENKQMEKSEKALQGPAPWLSG